MVGQFSPTADTLYKVFQGFFSSSKQSQTLDTFCYHLWPVSSFHPLLFPLSRSVHFATCAIKLRLRVTCPQRKQLVQQ